MAYDLSILTEQEVLAALPNSLKPIAAAVSFDDLIKLLDQFGGTQIYLPTKDYQNTKLGKVFDEETINTLRQLVLDDYLVVPRANKLIQLARNKRMRRAHLDDGKSMKDIAIEFGMTQRNVHKILNGC